MQINVDGMTVTIGNVKRGDKGEYVGRNSYGYAASPLGNMFVVGVHGERGECARKFGRWLEKKVADKDDTVMRELTRLRDILLRDGTITLLCWCAPHACHAEYIGRAIARMAADAKAAA